MIWLALGIFVLFVFLVFLLVSYLAVPYESHKEEYHDPYDGYLGSPIEDEWR